MNTRRAFALSLVTLVLVSVVEAGEISTWTTSLEIDRTQWLPGEPITAHYSFSNNSMEALPKIIWSLHLDGAKEPCRDRARLLLDRSLLPQSDETTSGQQDGRERFAPGTEYDDEIRISRICNIEMRYADRLYGQHRACLHDYRGNQLACVSFEIVRPEGADIQALADLPPRLRDMETDRHLVPATFLDEHPLSTYSGYILARRLSILPGVGRGTLDRVTQLVDPGFFDRFPKTYYHETPPNEVQWVSMEDAVRKCASQLRMFIDAHPGFSMRGKLERQLADYELVLGDTERAHAAWKWLAEHEENDKSRTLAQEYLSAIESVRRGEGTTAPLTE